MASHASPSPEGGFGVLELLVATALVVLAGFLGLAACSAIAGVLHASDVARQSVDGVDDTAARLRSDAASAFAVFVPPTAADGHPNAGREVDFYAKTDGGEALLWRYTYDAAAQTLQRWDYDTRGAAGVRDVETGAIDTGATYPPLRRVTRFAAATIPADSLGDRARNIYAGLAAVFSRPPAAHRVRYTTGVQDELAAGGNDVVQVAFADAATARVVHLAAGSLPAGFVVTGALVWHAVVYRVDQSHRFLFGLAGKSHVFINARVDVSYDGWATRATWCDFNLFGNPDGLDPTDPHANYRPDDVSEQAATILAACRQRQPVPPPRGSAGYPADADAVRPLPAHRVPPRAAAR